LAKIRTNYRYLGSFPRYNFPTIFKFSITAKGKIRVDGYIDKNFVLIVSFKHRLYGKTYASTVIDIYHIEQISILFQKKDSLFSSIFLSIFSILNINLDGLKVISNEFI